MPTMQPRYGRPRGSGLDDSRQLESIAALLAANPGLKPTTAIRSLGVEDPSAIRRLRDKFRMDQARLMANARHSFRSNGHTGRTLGRIAARRQIAGVRTNSPDAAMPLPDNDISVEPAHVALQPPLPAILFDLGLRALTTAIEQQAVLARHWLQHPAVDGAVRAQLAVGAFLVAVYSPRKPLTPRTH
jgi:hypothetical protein